MALFVASNLATKRADGVLSAVNAVRYSKDVNPFDIHRADLIFFASVGLREKALEAAHQLSAKSRTVHDVQLACKGLRNAAEVHSTFGDERQLIRYFLSRVA